MSDHDRKIVLTYSDCYHLVHFYQLVQKMMKEYTSLDSNNFSFSGYVKAMEKIIKEHMSQ